MRTDKLGRDIPFQIAKTTLSSKIFGRESDFFANMAVDAMAMVKEVQLLLGVLGAMPTPGHPAHSPSRGAIAARC